MSRTTHRPRGRPPTIGREIVLDAAIRLLDAEGVEALTMRRLASALGVSAMALYRHVGSKDELLMVLVDRLAARLVYPPRPRDPKGAMLVLWSTIYDSLAEHSWVPAVLARRLMWHLTLGALLVRAGASSEGPSQQRQLRGAPDPERYPLLAAAVAAWTAAHDRDTYREDLEALIDALLADARHSCP